MSLQLYELARRFALERGIILADTKFELGYPLGQLVPPYLGLVLGDEVLTPDSSRYWGLVEWQKAIKAGKLPPSFDKQFVREWGKTVGIHKRNPDNEEDIAYVHGLSVPEDVLTQTTRLYRYIFWRLTGQKLEKFQKSYMGINVNMPPVAIDVIIGSTSDADQVYDPATAYMSTKGVTTRLHVISCHRNPDALMNYAKDVSGVDVVVAAAGMAAQLPGVLKGWLDYFGKSHIPVIGVALAGKTDEESLAARLSMEQLPGQPVELNGGRAYFGKEGMFDAMAAAISSEFLPRKNQVKPPMFDIDPRSLFQK